MCALGPWDFQTLHLEVCCLVLSSKLGTYWLTIHTTVGSILVFKWPKLPTPPALEISVYLGNRPVIYLRGRAGAGTQIDKCVQRRVLTLEMEVRGPVES